MPDLLLFVFEIVFLVGSESQYSQLHAQEAGLAGCAGFRTRRFSR